MSGNSVSTGLTKVIKRLQPFAEFNDECKRELLPLCVCEEVGRRLDPWRVLDLQGQVVYLVRGELKINSDDGSSSIIVGGTEEALFPLGRARQAIVSSLAITDIELIRIDEAMLDLMLIWHQVAIPAMAGTACQSSAEKAEPANKVAQATDWSMMSGIFAARNLALGAFAALPPAHIEYLLQRFQQVKVKRGEVVIRQGDSGDYFYLIERGRGLVTRLVAGADVELAELKGGDTFGEEALIADSPRNATVTMKTDGILLRLSKQDFNELLRAPLLQSVKPDDALRRVAAGAVWLDVRFPAEYLHDGLPGARNIPLNDIRESATLLDSNKEYIVYCYTGRRSSAAAFLLSQRGLRASLLEGGLKFLGREFLT